MSEVYTEHTTIEIESDMRIKNKKYIKIYIQNIVRAKTTILQRYRSKLGKGRRFNGYAEFEAIVYIIKMRGMGKI